MPRRKKKRAKKPDTPKTVAALGKAKQSEAKLSFVRIPDPVGEMLEPFDHKVVLTYVDGRKRGFVVKAENGDEAKSYTRLWNLMHDGGRLLARGGVEVLN